MIKKWIEKIFGKFCKCEEKDPHVELYEDFPKDETGIKVACEKHPDTYKKQWPSCRETVNG